MAMYVFPTKFSGASNIGFKDIIMLLIQASIISKILQRHQQASSPAAFSPGKVQAYTSTE